MIRDTADFVVVGAGLTGLRTALDLLTAGASVLLLEARARVGGRVLSTSLAEPGSAPLVLDMGAQWIGPGQTEIMKLAVELGLTAIPTAALGRTTWALGDGVRHGQGWLPPLSPRALIDFLAATIQLVRKSRRISINEPWKAAKADRWDERTVDEWASRQFRTPEARAMLDIFVSGNIAVSPRDLSFLGLLFDLRSAGRLRDLESAEAFRIAEGAQELAVRLSRRLGDRVLLSEAVKAVEQDDHSVG